MQILPITLEITKKELVFSHADATPYIIPTLNQEDGLYIRFQLVRRINLYSRPLFERQALSGASIRAAVGSAANELAAANITTLSADGYELSGHVNLATAGINALADGAITTLEMSGFDGVGRLHAQFAVTVKKSVTLAASLTVPPGDTALGVLEANRIYVRKDGAAGDSIVMRSPLGVAFQIRIVDDGAGGAYFDASQIT